MLKMPLITGLDIQSICFAFGKTGSNNLLAMIQQTLLTTIFAS